MSPLPPPRSNPLENTNWRDLYRAALLELDPTKLAQRVAEAEGVIIHVHGNYFWKVTAIVAKAKS